ncbi:TMEM165/GDT1 family protein [Synechococcus sp. A15-24]|uniref:TMEM165/GDT1 family protein n=1 Tax=Synechococcus sp. A15-24 TaxID=1050635 RepID=UPI00164434AA|nr:TMEM165/GDT1 family protein [Synechococcus sp. A15-24]
MAGFTTAFATVAIAGVGDKSFLTTLVLAARHKARWVFTGSVSALTIGAGLWITAGVWMKSVISIDTIQIFSGVAFLLFGANAFLEARKMKSSLHVATNEEGTKKTFESVELAMPANEVIRNSFATTFLAEFGDRTQLALLALAAGPNISAESIFSGAVAANFLLAIMAVSSGKCLKKRLCQKRLLYISGALFIALGINILAH